MYKVYVYKSTVCAKVSLDRPVYRNTREKHNTLRCNWYKVYVYKRVIITVCAKVSLDRPVYRNTREKHNTLRCKVYKRIIITVCAQVSLDYCLVCEIS